MKKILLVCTCLAFTFIAKAQTEDKKWNIGLHSGVTQYQGDLGNNFYKTDKAFYGFGGISVSRYLGRYFDLNFLASKGTIGYNDGTVRSFKSDFNSVALNLRFNMTGPESVVRPYAFAGVGAILFDNDVNFDQDRIDYALPTAGGGLNFRLSDVITLNLQETFSFSNKDRRDGVNDNGKKDAYLSHMAGLTFNLGDKKDADNDGVADRKDTCPDTPAGVVVDENGCPLDRDKDGVADYLDTCPDVAGTALLNGCPDSDNDGVADINDKCPDTKPGTKVDATGCPMDNDKDGIPNDLDRCPDTAGPASLNGCPDTDGDGVADMDDRCPTVKGTMENKGCPEITKQDVERITYLGSKIFFENNSDKLKVGSLVQLDELVGLINKYDASNLVIEGHADSNGGDAFNLELSQRRTESVKNYLMEKGIAGSRLTAVGYGESKPIATNATAIGRAKNRRVELKMTYEK
ncbi:OmpA family protein [Flavobacterium xanthum]|uniref:Thrombospondin type 3 repeat-containing protein n=1 Tax=Flavobacterium xanthum TaxID=69322 RepID=A0A1M7LBC0_9FLAO|nr:OmpA family protein [Flavobacterium xanthum]SHM75366.1 Thrombospondin type 3 repeat-containing protein [Flavobacterium xanthum]